MSRFQIFIPEEVAPLALSPEDAMQKVGLGELSQGIETIPSPGPENQSGRLFVWLDHKCMHHGFNAEKQTWILAHPVGGLEDRRYWVGFWDDSPPTPQELVRPSVRASRSIELGDGNEWLLPRLGELDRYAMPQPDGTIKWCVDERYNWFCNEMQRLHDRIEYEDGKPYIMFDDVGKTIDMLLKVMPINYRITPEVCGHLRLFWKENLKNIVAFLMGLKLQGS